MDFNDFMNRAKNNIEMPKVTLISGLSHMNPKLEIRDPGSSRRREPLGSDYAIKYRLQDDLDLEREPRNELEEMEGLTSLAGTLPNPDEIMSERLTQVYEIYPFDRKNTPNLQVNQYKNEILEAIESNSVVIIKGATGCGKTTQVPQFILDQHAKDNIHCNIVVTQPRRIAARSVAKRVAEERGWGSGTIVGYQIALEKEAGPDTRLLYCTTGVLLQSLIANQSLSKYTHIIVDEVHERDQDTDFLLILLKTFLRIHGCRTKVILMSATMTTDKFQEYFTRNVKSGPPIHPPVITMKQEIMFPVGIFYLDDLASENASYLTVPRIDMGNPGIDKFGYNLACILIKVFHEIDVKEEEDERNLGAVLVFLPGLIEIENLHSALLEHQDKMPVKKEKWWICALHSSVTFDEQKNVFRKPPLGHRKIILATNIAESSITVCDVKYVIDFCLMKQQVQEPDTSYTYLSLEWVSKSQAEQRAGRVGRVRSGRVYRFLYKHDFEMLDKEPEPEILRCSLDSLVLKAKQLSPESPPAKILAWAIDPPDLSNIHRTIAYLKELGALMVNTNGKYREDDGDLTFIGHVMASLPIDVQLSRLIMIGHMFSLLREAVTMACTCSVRSVFSTPFKRQLEAYNSKIAWADSSCSDLVASILAYDVWKNKVLSGYLERSAGAREADLMNRFFIQEKSMKEVDRLEKEIMERLKRMNIVPTNHVKYKDIEKALMLKIIIAGAFYPNYFVRGAIDEKDAVKTLGGRNPFNTVYLTNMPMEQPGILYASKIKEYFNNCGAECIVSFDGSSKVYLTFEGSNDMLLKNDDVNKHIPGSIPMSVYRAIKIRHLLKHIVIPVLHPHDAWDIVKATIGEKALPEFSQRVLKKEVPLKSRLPRVTTEFLEVVITHVDSPSQFWIQIALKEYQQKLQWIRNTISAKGALVPFKTPPTVGQMVAAPYYESQRKCYFRARIKGFKDEKDCVIMYIDFGMCILERTANLMDFGKSSIELLDEPDMAMQCSLTEVQPAMKATFNGTWSNLAKRRFMDYFQDSIAYAKIYSTVNHVVSVILFHPKDIGEKFKNIEHFENSFNYHLIKSGLAERCDESYLSRENHIQREAALQRNDHVGSSASSSLIDHSDISIPSPDDSECRFKVSLKGPISPLEMKLYSLSHETQGKEVNVEWNSVNSVLLDPYPQDPLERFLVAGLVTLNSSGDKLTLRNTTMMPNIHGLLALVSMIFAPRVELRTDPDKTRLVGALCGLGYDPMTNEAYNPEKDMEINFDVIFDLDDITQINRLRFQMNNVVYGGRNWESEMNSVSVAASQEKIKDLILSLVTSSRAPQGAAGCSSFRWGIAEGLLSPASNEIDTGNNVIFPLIWGVKTDQEALKAKINESLKKITLFIDGKENFYQSITCELCQTMLEDFEALKAHVTSAIHCAALAHFNS